MSINGALQIGRSALLASQTGLQVAGNNMANAATEGYSRRALHLAPMRGDYVGHGQFIGRGVQVDWIQRTVDVALQGRHRDAISSEQQALIDQQFLSSIESLQNELTDQDLSSLLSSFFNSFSELANNPEDPSMRSLVLEEGQRIASHVADLRGEYQRVREEADQALGASVDRVNDLLDRISLLNRQIAESEAGVGEAASLRDQRDLLIDEVAGQIDVSVIEHPSGAADIFVGSIPIVLAGESRGIELREEPTGSTTGVSIRVADDGTTLQVSSGRIGALLGQREQTVEPAIDAIDEFAGQLIFQVNRVHSQGQGLRGAASVIALEPVDDSTVNLNAAGAGLEYRIENGTFQIHLTHTGSGARTSQQISVDGDAMSLDDLVTAINAAGAAVTASLGSGNRLQLDAAAGYQVSFSDDSSGALAALGINGFFSGSSAVDIAVDQRLRDDPTLLAAGAGHVAGSNENALAIAALQDEPVSELGGASLRSFWRDHVGRLAVRADSAHRDVQSTSLVRGSLAAQIQTVSGVSLDEEAISMLTFQRQFQAAARFIQVIDETMQVLLSI